MSGHRSGRGGLGQRTSRAKKYRGCTVYTVVSTAYTYMRGKGILGRGRRLPYGHGDVWEVAVQIFLSNHACPILDDLGWGMN